MLNLLRSDVYRLAHSRMVWSVGIFLVLFGGFEGVLYVIQSAGFTPGVFGFFTVGTDMGVSVGAVPLTQAWGQTFLSGGALPLMCSLAAAALASQDFSCGFERSLLSEGTGLRSYLGEKLSISAALCAVVLLVAIGSYQLAASACGGQPQAEAVASVLAWILLAWLHLTVYGGLSVVITWALHRRAAGVACAALIGSGVVGMCLWAALGALANAMPALGALASWLPYSSGQTLGQGAAVVLGPSFAHVLVAEVASLVAVALGAELLVRRGLRWW